LAISADPGVFAPRRLHRLVVGRADAIRDEGERRPVVASQLLPRMMGDDEDGVLEGRGLAPPAAPGLVLVPESRAAAEHAATHDRGADVVEHVAHGVVVLAVGAALHAVRLAPRPELHDPLVQVLALAAQRLL